MFEEDNLQRREDNEWVKLALSDNVLKELSQLKCDEYEENSNLFTRFFKQPPAKSLLDVPAIYKSAIDGGNGASFMEVEEVPVEEETRMDVSYLALSADADIPGTLNPMVDLVCSLDEQTATCEQLTGVSDQDLMSVLSKLSDSGLCHVCLLVCSMSASEQSRLGSLICRHLLLPKLQGLSGEPQNRGVVKAMVEFTKTFPHLSCSEVLLPLLLSLEVKGEKDSVLQIVTEGLSPEHRNNLLRIFLENEPTNLREWQIPLIQEMVSSSCGDVARQQLIKFLGTSADDFGRNIHFTKLLVSVIQQLGPGAPEDIKQQLAALVSSNKSVLKRAAEKALRAL